MAKTTRWRTVTHDVVGAIAATARQAAGWELRVKSKPATGGTVRWWTCGCGHKNCTRAFGTPHCMSCGKAARFTVEAPRTQGGLDFGAGEKEEQDGKVLG